MSSMTLPEAAGTPPDWVLNPSGEEETAPRSAAISVRFYRGPDPRTNELDQPVIDASGNIPIIELIEIVNRNDPKNSPMIHVATDLHRYKKFPREYARFRQGLDMQAEGTPLLEWLGDNDRTRNLAAWHVHTVEQLAALSDERIQALGPGSYELRTRAQTYLARQKDSSLAEKLMAENAEMKAQLAQLMALAQSGALAQTNTDESEEPARRKPGPKPKNQETN